jgi:uncharacterized protein (DUF433 family)
MTAHERKSIDPGTCHGRPVIRGTRVPVAVITGSLAGGTSLEQVAAEYDLSPEDIQAALAYVTEFVESERHLPLAGQEVHFLLDANLPRSMAAVAQRAGHACTHVHDTKIAGEACDCPDAPEPFSEPAGEWTHWTLMRRGPLLNRFLQAFSWPLVEQRTWRQQPNCVN